jgi:hypothetical protein
MEVWQPILIQAALPSYEVGLGMGRRSCLDAITKREITVPDWNWNPAVQVEASHLTDVSQLSFMGVLQENVKSTLSISILCRNHFRWITPFKHTDLRFGVEFRQHCIFPDCWGSRKDNTGTTVAWKYNVFCKYGHQCRLLHCNLFVHNDNCTPPTYSTCFLSKSSGKSLSTY